ncbi:thiamine-phosphate pyrophosphorylase [Roseivivax halotolerans]|uniref:Thiamine-phosphate pyrophosphorylase n=1 Tax=Roseivivax halotolerans TaxID=93684 RepID=A0A1I5YCL8_9RHOB|nr:thiamine phosphate synthase [Roseivivax halotolerans]SFQ41637.1 thiamine-phosphate pyrophosphorylase [Roseivivax halotolerans]
MAESDRPQIYLVTPPEIDLMRFPETLSAVLEAQEIACLRLSLATRDEDVLMRAADAIREIAHAFDVALVIDTHVVLADRLGLDGVHLTDGARSVRAARKELGLDAIVGAFCGTSRHDGMNAGEGGADYVSFGPVSGGALGDGSLAERDLFAWWSEMIEVPVVAEGGITAEVARDLAPVVDFVSVGEEIWRTDDPGTALAGIVAALEG